MAGAAARRVYKNPPIEEALVEFRFNTDGEWDPTVPGKLHDRVKDVYPGRPRQQKRVHAALSSVEGQPTTLAVHEGMERVQLVDASGLRLLSVGPHVMSVNSLRPYEDWERLGPRMRQAVHGYVAVAGTSTIQRIGVRYINKVVIPAVNLDLSHYFRGGPMIPAGLPGKVRGFMSRAEHEYDDGMKLLLTLASIESGPEVSEFLLDLDVVWEDAAGLDMDGALQRAEDLHQREGQAFEAIITDRTREVFDG